MKCFNHNSTDAVAVCAHCGRALCPGCIPSPPPSRLVCSGECATALGRNERALQQLLDKSVQSAQPESNLSSELKSGLPETTST